MLIEGNTVKFAILCPPVLPLRLTYTPIEKTTFVQGPLFKYMHNVPAMVTTTVKSAYSAGH